MQHHVLIVFRLTETSNFPTHFVCVCVFVFTVKASNLCQKTEVALEWSILMLPTPTPTPGTTYIVRSTQALRATCATQSTCAVCFGCLTISGDQLPGKFHLLYHVVFLDIV